MPSKEKSMCKGPEVAGMLTNLSNTEKVSVAGVKCEGDRWK